MSARPAPVVGDSLSSYAALFGAESIDRVRFAARALRGARVLHASSEWSTAQHGRLVHAAVLLMRELGIDVHLLVPPTNSDDAVMADALNEAIEGEHPTSTAAFTGRWSAYARRSAAAIRRPYDFVVVHDPLLLCLRSEAARRISSRGRWIWHCHADLSDCNQELAGVLADQASQFDVVAFEHPRFAGDLVLSRRVLIPPAIDPLSPRNKTLAPGVADEVFRKLNLPREQPMTVQVSRFDGWDDPRWALTTLDAARRQVPELRMVLISTTAAGDEALKQLGDRIDPAVVRLLGTADVDDIEINAIQGAAVAAMQHGARKGYSSALLEASWKGRPVLAADGGALCDQIVDGVTGYVFKNFDDGARKLVEFVRQPKSADAIGFAGHRLVRDNHLVIRWIESYLALLRPVRPTAVLPGPRALQAGLSRWIAR